MTRAQTLRRVWLAAFALALVGIPGASAALDGVTPPIATLAGTPGDNGWWRSKVTVTWIVDTASGSGFLSSDGCGPAAVNPDTDGTMVECSATYEDADGSTTYVTRKLIKIDATSPTVTGAVPARPPDRYGWYSHRIRVQFKGSDVLSGIASCTHPVYRGPTSAAATLTGQCKDMAGNVAEGAYGLKYANPFLVPKRGSRVSKPPKLDWPTVARAKFYNVQLWHKGKILSRWPRASSIQLHHHWHFAGSSHRLRPGRYDWYVWPRYKGRYHQLVGHGVFYKRAG